LKRRRAVGIALQITTQMRHQRSFIEPAAIGSDRPKSDLPPTAPKRSPTSSAMGRHCCRRSTRRELADARRWITRMSTLVGREDMVGELERRLFRLVVKVASKHFDAKPNEDDEPKHNKYLREVRFDQIVDDNNGDADDDDYASCALTLRRFSSPCHRSENSPFKSPPSNKPLSLCGLAVSSLAWSRGSSPR
jgi:hypothetical protein